MARMFLIRKCLSAVPNAVSSGKGTELRVLGALTRAVVSE